MRLSDWEATARGQQVMTEKVAGAYRQALAVLGAEPDPVAHVVWGDDPDQRYLILADAAAGLIFANVRVNVPQEGPRASAKLVRWGRVTVGELSVEAHHGRRQVTGQLEQVILQGTDEQADEIGAFVALVLARIDGRDLAAAAGSSADASPSGPDSNMRSKRAGGPIALPASTGE
jgi:hypothetical protein